MVAANRLQKYMAPRDGELVEVEVVFDEPAYKPNWTGLGLLVAFLLGMLARDILWR